MKTASMALGVVSGTLAILFAIFFIFGGVLLSTMAEAALSEHEVDLDGYAYELPLGTISVDDDAVTLESDHFTFKMKNVTEISGRAAAAGDNIVRIAMYVIAGLSAFGGLLAILGGILAHRGGNAAGSTMLIAAFFCIFTVVGILPVTMLLIAAMLSFVRQRLPAPPKPSSGDPDADDSDNSGTDEPQPEVSA